MRRGVKGSTLVLQAWLALAAPGALAQTIYPLDRAEILAGSRFDLKVEFPAAPAGATPAVTVDGGDPAALMGAAPAWIEREDGFDHTAYWIRGARLTRPGRYTVEARLGDQVRSVRWEVYGTPERRARNVILFVGDGLSVAHRTAARLLSRGMVEGRYGGELAMDDMPHMALVSTAGTDSIVADSANSIGAYTTGHKSCANALGVYCARNRSTLDHPKVETIAEVARRRGMAVGVVTNTEIQDATPAGMVAHIRQRREYDAITRMFHEAQPEVLLGGGAANFLPRSAPGSRRGDDVDYVTRFQADGYRFVRTGAEMGAAASDEGTRRLLGLFHPGNMDGVLDRRILKRGTVPRYPDQPDLVDQTRAALQVLSRAEGGFVLLVESGLIDKYSHLLDWERAVYDTIMLDNAVAAAKAFAAGRDDTLIVVVPDHAHPVSVVGTYDDARPGTQLRDKLGVYGEAGFPNYPPPDADGYPGNVDVSRRLAFVFGAVPESCDNGRPYLEGPNAPTVAGPERNTFVANEAACTRPDAVRRVPTLGRDVRQGVHAADDVILTAQGPGAELFRGRIDNTGVFRGMATALGFGAEP